VTLFLSQFCGIALKLLFTQQDVTTEMLSVMAKVCQKMLEMPELRSRLQHEETELFILRVMVAIIILYDHVHPSGAFAKGNCHINNNHLFGI
jgi:hypothetical protein